VKIPGSPDANKYPANIMSPCIEANWNRLIATSKSIVNFEGVTLEMHHTQRKTLHIQLTNTSTVACSIVLVAGSEMK